LEISVQQLWAPGKNSVMYERWTPVSGQPIERALDFGNVGGVRGLIRMARYNSQVRDAIG
jgi:hypothetical protein